MNHMVEVAKMLGVKLGEEFRLEANGIVSKNKFRLTEHGLFIDDCDCKTPLSETLNDILTDLYDVVKISEPILSETEKEYLSHVIKPFREKILHISKLSSEDGESICIDIRYDWEEDSIVLPKFAAGTLYKGMKIGKEYSIKELNL